MRELTPTASEAKAPLDLHFARFRAGIVGADELVRTPEGLKPITYLDWTASGRLFEPLEEQLKQVAALYGNAHSHDSAVGDAMTTAYERSREVIHRHVGAGPDDVVVFKGSGMTGAVNWFQRATGFRDWPADARPVVFITHMEHHSNQTSWIEAGCEVFIVPPGPDGRPDPQALSALCKEFEHSGRPLFGSFTACSNVTGITTDYHAMAKILHQHGGRCFVDFAASAPYVDINMHPPDPLEKLDAIFFSPHKFLGGPGSPGIVVFDKALYARAGAAPVEVGGGVVSWTNPWGEHRFLGNIVGREDAGTPPILQAMRAAMAVHIKERMGVEKIQARKDALMKVAFAGLKSIPGVEILEGEIEKRQGIISFTLSDVHYGLAVKLLNDKFGIQARAGCSCAGTYGHYLFGIDSDESHKITDRIDAGDSSVKPGWIRVSFHPTTTLAEVERLLEAVRGIAEKAAVWAADYKYEQETNSWRHRNFAPSIPRVDDWLMLS